MIVHSFLGISSASSTFFDLHLKASSPAQKTLRASPAALGLLLEGDGTRRLCDRPFCELRTLSGNPKIGLMLASRREQRTGSRVGYHLHKEDRSVPRPRPF
jgi:hypothetical protein